MSKDCEVLSTSPLLIIREDQARAAARPRGEPIAVLPAPVSEVKARAVLFLSVADVAPLKITCVYLYRKTYILYRRFRIWDEAEGIIRASQSAYRLRWFDVDRRNGYQLLNIWVR